MVGIDVLITSSWFVVALLISLAFGPRIEAAQPGLGFWKYVAGFVFAVVLYLSVLLHEASHAVVAKRLGYGVNSITLHFLGGMTEVDGQSRRPRHEFWFAVVGPLTSIAVGAASGAVAGLVAITPSCANLAPGWALLLGVLSGALCALAVELKYKLGYDDSLDVVGIHLVGGLLGTVYLGFFAIDTGLFLGGGFEQLILQIVAVLAVLTYSFVVALVLGFGIEKTIGFRVRNEDEIAGVDTVMHGEEGYVLADRIA
ncbi:MAG: hypothetical protein M3Y46_02130 [Actinomycetota bacterium]|nr:hypothetical protein [Actinomycetota bacterium]